MGHAAPPFGYRRHERHVEQLAHRLVVETVSGSYQLVVHVERGHHIQLHIYELRSKKHITLYIGAVYHIDYHVKIVLLQMLRHHPLLWRVCRYGICAGQIGEAYPVVAETDRSLRRIDRDARIVAHMLVKTRQIVEQRGFTAVGVAYQRHVYSTRNRGFVAAVTESIGRDDRPSTGNYAGTRRLILGHYLYVVGLGTPQRHFVAHKLVLYGIAHGGVPYHSYLLAAHEAHLGDTPTEIAVSVHSHNNGALSARKF